MIRQLLDHLFPMLLRKFTQLRRDLIHYIFGPESLIIKINSLHRNEIHRPSERILSPDGYLYRNRVCAQPVHHRLYTFKEIRTDLIHLVDKGDPRYMVFIRLPPDRFRLGFHTLSRIEYGHSPIQNPERPLHLYSKIHVAGGIDNVDPVILPEGCRCSRYNGNAARSE